ncbi:MAG: RDD family protein, partial [Myxococcales bacterium]|nr:RDD family protein [Myxococcales bacterium]
LGSGGRRTVGKWLTGLEVMHLSGRPPTLLEAFQRFLAYFVTVGSGVGLVALVQDRNGRANHDRMVHTVVLRRR